MGAGDEKEVEVEEYLELVVEDHGDEGEHVVLLVLYIVVHVPRRLPPAVQPQFSVLEVSCAQEVTSMDGILPRRCLSL